MMAKPVASIFLPLTPATFGEASPQGVTLLIRGAAGADSMAAVRREIESVDAALTLFNVHPMSEYLSRFRVMLQWSSVVNGSLGVFGLILSCIGLAAVTSHAVARRRKEIGIRMALGARSGQVLRLVLKEGVVLVVVGSVLGFLGATALTRLVPSFIADLARILAVGTGEPWLVIGGPLLLASLALIACYLPARRSTKIDPLMALRDD
jgi:ABC-type lipoprotein release transport system permease subunit